MSNTSWKFPKELRKAKQHPRQNIRKKFYLETHKFSRKDLWLVSCLISLIIKMIVE